MNWIIGIVCLAVGVVIGYAVAYRSKIKAEFDSLHNRLSAFESKVSTAISALKK